MQHRELRFPVAALMALGLAPWLVSPADAEPIRISVTNNLAGGGFGITPVWFGIHDGTFDLFDPGEAASAQLEAVAELGDTGPLTTLFEGEGPQGTLASGGAAPPFLPGQSNGFELDVMNPSSHRYLSFASMLVPSNDLFLGNPNPLAYPIFDDGGNFLGPLTIRVFGRMVWDAGTEVNDIADGAAFVAGLDASGGTAENGVVGLFFDRSDAGDYLSSIAGTTIPTGGTISRLFTPDDLIATIHVVPEPAAMAQLGLGIGVLVLAGIRRRRGRNRASKS